MRANEERGGGRGPLVAFLAVGLLVWTLGALRRSLWTDEFHSLHHVRRPGFAEFLHSIKTDNHPPLSFFLERLSTKLFGEAELALRLPSILAGLAFVLVLWRLARPAGRRASGLALSVALASSFAYVVFTEARMYGLLALAVLGMTLEVHRGLLPREGGERRVSWPLAAWIAVGLHSHYYFLHYLFVMGLCVVLIFALRPELRGRVLRGLPPVLLGLVAWLPWALYGFLAQLNQDYPPGGHESGLGALAQGFFHLLFMNTGFAPSWYARFVALPVATGVLLSAVLGVQALVRESDAPHREERDLLWLLVGAMAFAAPAWAVLATELFDRASFGWRYIAGSLGPLALLAGCGLASLPRRASLVTGALLVLGLASGVAVNARGGEREDYRSAVSLILREALPGDAVVVKPLWDPAPEDSPDGWRYYSSRLARTEDTVPEVVSINELRSAKRFERVWIFQRDPYSAYALRALRQWFAEEHAETHGLDLILYLFSSRKAP